MQFGKRVLSHELQGLQWQLLHICKSRPDIVLIGRMTCWEGIEPESVGCDTPPRVQDSIVAANIMFRTLPLRGGCF